MSRRWRAFVATLIVGATAAVAASPSSAGAVSTSDLARSAIEDVQDFWTTTLPELYGAEYQRIPDDRLYPYGESNPPPACGGAGTTPYKDVAGNAFYCPEGDFVAWDTQGLIAKLRQRYGDLAVALVFAHEWGHVVQQQTGTSASETIPLELQADCFAGAWARHATKTSGDPLDVQRRELEQALSGYLYFRDPVGTSPGQVGAHGSAFDRISAFNDGLTHGAERCKAYETDPPIVTEIPFTTSSDLANEGNLPFADLLPSVRKDLDAYWVEVLGKSPVAGFVADAAEAKRCGASAKRPVVACSDGVVAYIPAALRTVYDTYGDYAAATLMAKAWADAAVKQGDVRATVARKGRVGECMAGAWAGDLVNGTRREASSLSPGDLDEAVAALIAYPAPPTRGNDAFVRFRAFRDGFVDGADACGAGTKG